MPYFGLVRVGTQRLAAKSDSSAIVFQSGL